MKNFAQNDKFSNKNDIFPVWSKVGDYTPTLVSMKEYQKEKNVVNAIAIS